VSIIRTKQLKELGKSFREKCLILDSKETQRRHVQIVEKLDEISVILKTSPTKSSIHFADQWGMFVSDMKSNKIAALAYA
jgi:hypothetical protein